MIGKDLIIYILSNNLENEPVYKDGKLLGFLTIEEAAVKLEVGTPTILALMFQGKLDAICIGSEYFISADCELLNNKNE